MSMTALKMLIEIVPKYEEHHNLKAGEDVMKEATQIVQKILKERLTARVRY